MISSRLHKSEEARRQAMAVTIAARERQSAMLEERAASFAIETQKVETLRALRLAAAATQHK